MLVVLTASTGVLALVTGARPVRLAGADPADRALLATSPAAVTLSFTARPDPEQTHVTVVGPAGRAVTNGPPQIAGAAVRQQVSIVDAGSYVVGYHVVFAGGRELTGQETFTVRHPGGGTDPPPVAGSTHSHGAPDPLTAGFLVLDGLAVVVGLAALRWRSTGRRDS
jgi:methionine-rich copper-binding protein CopC